jgi:hypothetical protein
MKAVCEQVREKIMGLVSLILCGCLKTVINDGGLTHTQTDYTGRKRSEGDAGSGFSIVRYNWLEKQFEKK